MNRLQLPHLIKTLFFVLRLHKIFGVLRYPFLWIAYMSQVGQMACRLKGKAKNDFPNFRRDYEKRYDLYRHLIKTLDLSSKPILYLEFGVSKGYSLRFWSSELQHPDSRLYGFDTFKGLPEAWGTYQSGDMKAAIKDLEITDERVTLVKGLFQQTLPEFIQTIGHEKFDRKVIHLDADLYSSTLFTLATIFPMLKAGDLLIFDEFNVPLHEFKALDDFCKAWYAEVEFVGAVNNYFQAAFLYKGQKLPQL